MLEQFSKKAIALALFSALPFSYSVADQSVETRENDDEIIFTANRSATLASEVGSQSVVITEREIQTRQYHTATEALMHQPGVILSQNGTNGPSTLFIRGANSQNTLVLVDGVPLGDPMGTGRMVDFALLGALLDVNRIEVLKGPQSSLYGSSAMGGVIQIFTNHFNNPGTKLRLMAGSNRTMEASVMTSGQVGDLRYSLGGLMENSHGIDATTDSAGKLAKDDDQDGYKHRQLSAHFNYLLTENLDLDFTFTHNKRFSEYDNGWNSTLFNDYNRSQLFTGRLALNGTFFEDQLASTFAYSQMRLNRDDYSGGDVYDAAWMPIGTEESHYRYRGKTETFNFDHELSFDDRFKSRFGLAYQREQGSGDDGVKHRQNTKSLYLEQDFDFLARVYNTLGIRYDRNTSFGSKTTYRLTSRYNMSEKLAFKGSFGTGFTTPSIYQYYVNGEINPTLKAETSRGFDLGMEFKPTATSQISVSYFYTTYKNMIDYYAYPGAWQAPWGEYQNLDRAKMSGIEIGGSLEVTAQLALSGSYTYLEAKQKDPRQDYERMLRRPRHQITANITYQPIANLTLNVSGIYYSKREDVSDKSLSSFAIFDMAGSYKINHRFEVDAKIQNLFNKKYEFADGYRERGRSAYVGVNISL